MSFINTSNQSTLNKKDYHNKIISYQKSLVTALHNINNSMKLNQDAYIEENNCLSLVAGIENINSTLIDMTEFSNDLKLIALNKSENTVINKVPENRSKQFEDKILLLEKIMIEAQSISNDIKKTKFNRIGRFKSNLSSTSDKKNKTS